jgi:general secretion pathway protein I
MSRRTQRGFTLIEVLVALVIVAVGMSAMMGALTSSARTVVYMQDKTFAEWVALNQIANDRLQLGQGLDNFAGRSWHWRQDVVASQVPGIMRIDVKVRPKEVKGGDDDNWYVTVSGLAGNGIGLAGSSEAMINWDPTPGSTNGTGPNTGTTSQTQGGTTGGTTNGTTGSSGLPGVSTTPTPTPSPNTNP